MRKFLKLLSPIAIIPSMIAPITMASCGATKMYKYVKKLTDYLHLMIYDDYREDTDYETIKEAEPFGCSSVRNGNFYGRNFDYVYNDTPEFVVRVKANKATGRHESIAISTHFGLREDKLNAGAYDKSLELIPNLTMDGINDCGVICSSNVVSMEPNIEGVIPETHPDKPELKRLHALFIPRYVLDHATSAEDAVGRLQNDVNIFGNLNDHENLHIMIADAKETYVVEFYRSTSTNHFDVNVKKWTEPKTNDDTKPIMTNHYITDDLTFTNDKKFGNERYSILNKHYDEGTSFEGMYSLMQRVTFSQAYIPSYDEKHHDPVPMNKGSDPDDAEWYSEMIDQTIINKYDLNYPQDNQPDPDLKKSISTMIATKEGYKEKIRKNRNPAYWITTHNSTYDIEHKILRITVQEEYETYFEYTL